MRIVAVCAFLLSCFTGFADGPYYSINCDSQDPGVEHVIDNVFSGNTPFLRSYHYDSDVSIDLTPWTMEFYYSYGQFDTNGGVTIPGVVTLTNCVTYLGATNVFFQPFDKYYFSIKGTHNDGYVKTFATGRMIQDFDPATDTNLVTMMGQINMNWFTNNVGAQVESNRIQIAILVTGKVDQVDFNATNVIFEARITSNTTAIVSNDIDIAENAGNISTNTGDISTNTTGVAANLAAIGSNDTEIAENAGNISTNTTGIAANLAAIGSNDTDIAANAGAITTNTTSVTTEVARATAAEATKVSTTNATYTATVANASTAYGWEDHADAGYLTTGTNLFTEITIANRGQTTTNLCTLTDGTYTGVISSVAFTGTCTTVKGRTYIWGFTKQNVFGTGTLSASTFTLTATEAGAVSNYFTPSTVVTQVVLRIDGDGSSKSDVTAVYLKQITNGNLYVAGDTYIGKDIHLGSTSSFYFSDDVDITSEKIQLYDTFDAAKAGTASVATVATDLNTASNVLNAAITTEVARATAAENINTTSITIEVARAIAAEGAITNWVLARGYLTNVDLTSDVTGYLPADNLSTNAGTTGQMLYTSDGTNFYFADAPIGVDTNESWTYADGTTQTFDYAVANSFTLGGDTRTNWPGEGMLLSGSMAGTGAVNTVTFSTAFTSTPNIVVGWVDTNLNQIAQAEIIVKSASAFNWQTRNTEGVTNVTWTINWQAASTKIIGGAGGGGEGDLTGMLSTDSSIVWTDSGGPQPDGSVTNYVEGVVAGYVPTNDTTYTTTVGLATTAMQDLVDDTSPILATNLDMGGFVLTNGEWQGTAIADAYVTKTGDWTGQFDGQQGTWYRDWVNITNHGNVLESVAGNWSGTFDSQDGTYYKNYANITNKAIVVTNNETGLTLGGNFTSTGTLDGEEGSAFHDAANFTGNIVEARLTNAAGTLGDDIGGNIPGATLTNALPWDGSDDWTGTFDGQEGTNLCRLDGTLAYTANQNIGTHSVTNAVSFGFTNGVMSYAGTLNSTNGVYWAKNGTNYWLLFE